MTEPIPNVLALARDIEDIGRAINWIEIHAVERGVSDKVNSILQMVVEEVLANVIIHAQPKGEGLDIELQWIDPYPGTIRIEIHDSGTPFNPLESPEPDTTLSVEDREVGGLGIHLIRRYMDQCFYERVNNRNILALVRRIDA